MTRATSHQVLFRGNPISGVLDAQLKHLRERIECLAPEYVCAVDEMELARSLTDEHRIDVPVLGVDNCSVEPREERRCEKGDFDFYDYTVNIYTVRIPFTGEAVVFNFRPNSIDLNPPRATISGQEVMIVLEQKHPDAMALKMEVERTIQSIEKNLHCLREMVDPFNGQLLNIALEQIKRRKEKVGRDVDVLAGLGIPVRQRSNVPTTVVVPVERKRIPLPQPHAAALVTPTEPSLSEGAYQQIIKTMADMALVIERNPTAFEHLSEEQIRFQFLVPLNALYEGNATAETFSYEGKTDIQIRSHGKPIFTAECKFWTGRKGLGETINQLLRYTTWRDTRTAVLLFNRQKDFSKVIAQIEPAVMKHPRFVRFEGITNETQFRFVLAHPNDVDRHIVVTMLLFDIP